ncbi:MAG: ACP S-malonyltransferase [Gammaproteobacteria bacterium]
MTDAFLFPGQGSQSVGMMDELREAHPLIDATFEEASDAIGTDLAALVKDGPVDKLNQTVWTQPVMLAAGVATFRAWRAKGGAQPDTMAGHSLGEYSALVCAGAVGLADATRLVARRAQLMQSAVAAGEGAMVAIIGLKDEQVAAACAAVANGDVVEPVNFNAPGQVVVAGSAAAVARLAEKAEAEGARRVLPLPVSVPSHCALMRPAAETFATDLAAIEFTAPEVEIIHNAGPVAPGSVDGLRDALARQLYSPVPWSGTVQSLLDNGTARFYECGPGRVLTGLVKRIHRRAKIWSLHDAASMDEALLHAAEIEKP